MPLSVRLFKEMDSVDPPLRHILLDFMDELEQQREAAVTKVEFKELRDLVVDNTLTIKALAEAQVRTEARVEQLAEAQVRTEARVEQLAEAQVRTEAQVRDLVFAVNELKNITQRHEVRLGVLDGRTLEQEFREKAVSKFARLLRRTKLVKPAELEEWVEAKLTDKEREDILLLDIVVQGKAIGGEGVRELYLATEISVTLDEYDLERAVRRAGLLRRCGLDCVAVIAGQRAGSDLIEKARQNGSVLLLENEVYGWPEALAAYQPM